MYVCVCVCLLLYQMKIELVCPPSAFPLKHGLTQLWCVCVLMVGVRRRAPSTPMLANMPEEAKKEKEAWAEARFIYQKRHTLWLHTRGCRR